MSVERKPEADVAAVHQVVERLAAAHPDRIAVCASSSSITYGELNRRANRLARILIDRGIGANDRVAVLMDRTVDLVAALLAVHKAGAGYVPIDPTYPAERVRLLLEVSGARCVLAPDDLAEPFQDVIPGDRFQVIDREPVTSASDAENPGRVVRSDHLAYVMYTSGSTGAPKGVMIEHRSLTGFVHSAGDRLKVTPDDRVFGVITICFDLSVFDIFFPLAHGLSLHLANESEVADPRLMAAAIDEAQPTIMLATPATWRMLVLSGWSGLAGLRGLSCGEALPRRLVDDLLDLGVEVWNAYGPTEATIFTSLGPIGRDGPVDLGPALDFAEMIILDDARDPVEPGVIGELYLGGACVARGYLDQPELTAAKFVELPGRDGRWFRVGDLCQFDAEHGFLLHGRIDQQIKVHGFRIEPEEVEAALEAMEGVNQAAVIAVGSDVDRRLVAYITVDSDREGFPDSKAMRSLLRKQLPAHLVPTSITTLDALPMTLNQKIDRARLPAPDEAGITCVRGASNDSPRDTSIDALFRRQAAQRPEAVAINAGGRTLTYGELDRWSDRVAAHLLDQGLPPRSRIAIHMPRSPEFVVGVLAVLKAGASYLPLDPDAPASWRHQLIEITDSPMVLVHADHERPTVSPGVGLLDVEDCRAEVDVESPLPDLARHPDDEAYVMFTSGSTGVPKGVSVPHRAVVRLVFGQEYLPFDDQQVFLLHSNPAFDASTLELWGPLLHGGRLAIAPASDLDLLALGECIQSQQVTCLWLTAALFNTLIDDLPEVLDGVDWIVTGGEALSVPHVRAAMEALPETTLVNGYGPTEATTFACTHRIPRGFPADASSVPIGRPLANTHIYLLDESQQGVDRGSFGEIWIGGDGVALGYLNDPALTADRFRPDPLSAVPGAQMYRTGDRGRLLDDGTIEFLGRVDRQVKIRGQRVEPGEVEAALQRLEMVAQAAVEVEGEGDDRRLVAYVTPGRTEPSPHTLREALESQLPRYLVPGNFVILDALPRNANGKIDRSRLASLRTGPVSSATVMPRTDTEHQLSAIWCDVLGLSEVSVGDDFFDLGGQSLKAAVMLARVSEQMGRSVALATVFACPTIERLARHIDGLTPNAAGPSIPLQPRDESLPLSFAQQRLWYLEGVEETGGAYNVPFAIRIRGDLNLDRLRRSAAAVVARHEILRTSIREVNHQPQQVIHAARLPWEVVDAVDDDSAQLDERMRRDARRSFDLAAGPLLRVTIFRCGADEHVMLLTMHHLIVDLWSARLLVDEISAAYAASSEPESALEPQAPRQFADFAGAQRKRLTSDFIEPRLRYWERQLCGVATTPPLNADHGRPPRQQFAGESHHFRIDEDLAECMDALARARHQTPFAAWLAASAMVVARVSDRSSLLVGTHVSQRRERVEQEMLGFFLNTVPIRIDVPPRGCFGDLLDQINRTVVDALANADAPLEKIIECAQPVRDVRFSPLFQVAFVWTDQDEHPQLMLPGCECEAVRVDTGTAKFDVTIELCRTADGIDGRLEYASDLFDAATIEQLAAQLIAGVASGIQDPERLVTEIVTVKSPSPDSQASAGGTPAPVQFARSEARGPGTETERAIAAMWSTMLDVDDIAAADDFFDLGGHSMRAVEMLGRVERELGVVLPMAVLARASTVAALAKEIEKARCDAHDEVPLPHADRTGRLPLSFAQHGMWFLETTAALQGAYNEAFTMRLNGPLNVERLKAACAAMQARHEVLRTVFDEDDDGVPFAVIRDAPDLPWRCLDESETPVDGVALNQILHDDARQSFDLHRGPLWRAFLVPIEHDASILQCTFHHAIIDDWSARLFCAELSQAYAAAGDSSEALGEKTGAQYVDWASWQRNALDGSEREHHLQYWEQHLRNEASTPVVPTDRPRPSVFSYKGDIRTRSIDEATTRQLDEFSKSRHRTLFSTLLAGTGAVLARRAGQSEILVGTPVSQRHRHAEQQMLGVFLNMLPIRVSCAGRPTFCELVNRVHREFSAAVEHQAVPFDQIVERVRPVRSRSFNPLFQVAFVWLEDEPPVLELPDCTVHAQSVHTGSSKFDLTVEMRRQGDGIVLRLEYATDLFDAETIESIGDELVQFLDRVSLSPQDPINLDAADESGAPAGGVQERADDQHATPVDAADPKHDDEVPHDELERRLLELWRAVLENPDVGLHDDFFELGGHSLDAARLATRASRDLGLRLPVNLVFQSPTVQLLAAELRGPQVTDAFTAIAVQPRGSQPPLFYIPGLGGSAFVLPDLSYELGEDQPIYALQAHSVSEQLTVEGYAAACIACIKGVAPTGPYRLIGYSLGGTFAFESAQQLKAAGEPVELLMIIDHFATGTRFTAASIIPAVLNLPVWFASFLRTPPKRLMGVCRRALQRATKLITGRRGDIRAADYVGDGVWSAEMRAVAEAHFAAYQAYQPKEYPGQIILVRAHRQPILAPTGHQHGWGPLARDGVSVKIISGGHMNMLEGDGAVRLAQSMFEALNPDGQPPEGRS